MPLRPPAGFISAFFDPLQNPNAPAIGVATGISGGVSIAFTAPFNVGGSAITSYRAFATDSSSGAVFTNTGASSPISITGLTTGNNYTVRVVANNSFGPSAYSAASNSASPVVVGQQAFTTAGTYTWVAPAGVTSVSVVAVGGGRNRQSGSSGGGGGGLGYRNNIAVTPGSSYTVVVGAQSQDSYFIDTSTVRGGLSNSSTGGTFTGDGGGNGGNAGQGGGGAGGYSGNGGVGGSGGTGGNGNGGGGGGGCGFDGSEGAGGGGGVGILGQGTSGAGGSGTSGGAGGSGGDQGANVASNGRGGLYGGGAGGNASSNTGGSGAVRIIWPGTTRFFPSTNTGNL